MKTGQVLAWGSRACRGYRQIVALLLAEFLSGRPDQVAEDGRTSVVVRNVGHARHDVEVDVGKSFVLGELDDVGLHAAGHLAQGSGQPDLPGAQGCGLVVGELGDG